MAFIDDYPIRSYPEYADTYEVEAEVIENGLDFTPEWSFNDDTEKVECENNGWKGAEHVTAENGLAEYVNHKVSITPVDFEQPVSVTVEQYKETVEIDSTTVLVKETIISITFPEAE